MQSLNQTCFLTLWGFLHEAPTLQGPNNLNKAYKQQNKKSSPKLQKIKYKGGIFAPRVKYGIAPIFLLIK